MAFSEHLKVSNPPKIAGKPASTQASGTLFLTARQVITARQAMTLHFLVEGTTRQLQHFHHCGDVALTLQQGVVQALRLEGFHLLRQRLAGKALGRRWAGQPLSLIHI